jgi:hypothetical protein
MVMPVHCSNSAHDLFSESDSGLRIEPNIVTVVPEWPMYCEYCAHAPVADADADPPLVDAEADVEAVLLPPAGADELVPPVDLLPLEHAAASSETAAKVDPTATRRRRGLPDGKLKVMVSPLRLGPGQGWWPGCKR